MKVIPGLISSRIRHAHPCFVPNNHNLRELCKLLDRRDWAKNIHNIDDFAFRWSSDSDTSLYGQLDRVTVKDVPCIAEWNGGRCGNPVDYETAGKWICADCADKTRRHVKCPRCDRDIFIPDGWTHPENRGRCLQCRTIFAVPAEVVGFVRDNTNYQQGRNSTSPGMETSER